jgi:hypothetical protein
VRPGPRSAILAEALRSGLPQADMTRMESEPTKGSPSVPYTRLLRQALNLAIPIGAIESLVELRRFLYAVERDAVVAARVRGATWDQIGSALGISRQAAYLRHGAYVAASDLVSR